MSGDSRGPLEGLLVADFSRILAGPYATMLLADLGADVVKVEGPRGDDTRSWMPPVRDGVSTYYLGHPIRFSETPAGASALDKITLLGQDLATDAMGEVGFGELAFWLATQRRPTRGETRVFEAVPAALADHGFTPTAIVTRLTYLSAPDSVQGALAAGLLGGRLALPWRDGGLWPIPAQRADGGGVRLPGRGGRMGHSRACHRAFPAGDRQVHPRARTPRAQARRSAHRAALPDRHEEQLFGPHLSLFAAIGRGHQQVLGWPLPLSGAGVCGAALADLGLPLDLLRGFALLARTAGLIGQLAEELRTPVANDIFLSVDLNNTSVPPQPSQERSS
ncbi:CoA transferase [Streptomyces sp. NPDC006655]|uniref:CoA transferase n=1 Tax=Streptomyces sp. NPDC006655 TaxID=3156898 RepID=UPI0034543EF7